MSKKKKILAIIGSASPNSSNEKLVEQFAHLTKNDFDVTIFNGLKTLPHFDPELSAHNPPQQIIDRKTEDDLVKFIKAFKALLKQM